ncbi:MAG: ABC transporter ATP-binding protein [Proteobacteria bacterium]|nr:ABC transporter ATP-binding protein [Pseudomonadota bacterium]
MLKADTVSKRFGGLTALSGVSLKLKPGEVHGLIGPNGSGKTTLLNMISGYYPVDEGRVLLDGDVLNDESVAHRARRGIARTFQKPRLLGPLSVLDNAMLGGWRDVRSGFLATALAMPQVLREERELKERARELLVGVGLAHAVDRPANLLEHAEQRFLEIARGLMAAPRFLLLDEPAGGLTPTEIDHLGTVISTLREAGLGILLVEHHTDFVFRISDRVTALDLGRLVRHGTPDEVRNDAEVIRVYLGA